MKTSMVKFTILLVGSMVLCASCTRMSHNLTTIAAGKVTRLGVADYGLLYVNGLVVMEAVRENTETVVETNDGDKFGNPDSVLKGIRSIRFRTAGQCTGYLKDLAKKSPEAALRYVENMPKMNKAAWDSKQDKAIDIESASKAAEEIVNPFDCNGNCDLQDLWKNNTIAYQNAVAVKLLNYTDDKATFPDSKTTFYHSLQSFITRLAKLTVRGRTVTQMRVKYAKIKDNQITDLMFVMIEPDGNTFDTTCPECVMEDE